VTDRTLKELCVAAWNTPPDAEFVVSPSEETRLKADAAPYHWHIPPVGEPRTFMGRRLKVDWEA
jgi:hypothetical protein